MTIVNSTALPKVSVIHHDGGVTLDFRLPEDPRDAGRRRAWWTFEVGIFLLIGSIFWFALFIMMEWREFALSDPAFVATAFFLGLGLLISAANISSRVWRDASSDDDVRQLVVADNVLMRTSRDHRKQIWYRQEIRSLTVEAESEPTVHVLTVHLHTGEKVELMRSSDAQHIESIADMLRQALAAGVRPSALPSDAIQADRSGIKH